MFSTTLLLQALLDQLPLLLSNIASVWLELEASGADDPSSDRGEVLCGGGLWSGSIGGGWEDEADLLVSQSLTASEESAGEAGRRQAVSVELTLVVFSFVSSVPLG